MDFQAGDVTEANRASVEPPNNGVHPTRISRSFIDNLPVSALRARRVTPGFSHHQR